MIAFIKKLWKISWDPWEHHNAVLHNEQEAENLHELAFIKEEIKQKIQIGIVDIPI